MSARRCRLLVVSGPLTGTPLRDEANDADNLRQAGPMPRRAAVSVRPTRDGTGGRVLLTYDAETGPMTDEVVAVLALDEGKEADRQAQDLASRIQRILDTGSDR